MDELMRNSDIITCFAGLVAGSLLAAIFLYNAAPSPVQSSDDVIDVDRAGITIQPAYSDEAILRRLDALEKWQREHSDGPHWPIGLVVPNSVDLVYIFTRDPNCVDATLNEGKR